MLSRQKSETDQLEKLEVNLITLATDLAVAKDKIGELKVILIEKDSRISSMEKKRNQLLKAMVRLEAKLEGANAQAITKYFELVEFKREAKA